MKKTHIVIELIRSNSTTLTEFANKVDTTIDKASRVKRRPDSLKVGDLIDWCEKLGYKLEIKEV